MNACWQPISSAGLVARIQPLSSDTVGDRLSSYSYISDLPVLRSKLTMRDFEELIKSKSWPSYAATASFVPSGDIVMPLYMKSIDSD